MALSITARPIGTRALNVATLAEQLDEARAALHDLAIGKAMTEFRDSNGEVVRYSAANRPALLSYIGQLERSIGDIQPVRTIHFRTSKGI